MITQNIKKIFAVTCVCLFIFNINIITAGANALGTVTAIVNFTDDRLDFNRFYAINPKPIRTPANEAEGKYFDEHYSGVYAIKTGILSGKNQEQIALSKIYGTGAIPMETIKKLADKAKLWSSSGSLTLALLNKPGNEILLFAKKLIESTPNIDTKNKLLLIVDLNYYEFKILRDNIYKSLEPTSGDYTKTAPFYAGFGVLYPHLLKETIDYAKTIVGERSSINVTDKYKIQYVIVDGTPENNAITEEPGYLWYFSGACFEVKPPGVKNLCTDTLFKASGNAKGCKFDEQRVYFLNGITCSNLNSILLYEAALDTNSEEYKEKIEAATLKEKTLFKPQVPFGGITEGTSLPEYINLIYKYLMGFSLVVTGFVIVIGGAKYMIGQNDGIPMIRNAFIGVLLLSSTYIILKTISPSSVDLSIIEISEIGRKTLTAPPRDTQTSTATTTASSVKGATLVRNEEIIAGCAAPINTIIDGCVDLENSEERITDPARMAQLAKKFGSDQGLGLYYHNASQGLAVYGGSIPGNFDSKKIVVDKQGKKTSVYVDLKSATFVKNTLKASKNEKGQTSVFSIVEGTKNSAKTSLSCIGYIQAYYSCLGRPFYGTGAHTALVTYGNLITDINIGGGNTSISINGRPLEVGDVIGWVGWERFKNAADNYAAKAKSEIESIATSGSTIAPLDGGNYYSVKINRTVNGKAKVIEHKIPAVSHVVLYIGNGEFFDWGTGTVSKLGSSTERGGAIIHDAPDLKFHSYVIFLNQVEKDSYEKFKKNKYGVTSCKQLWDKVKAAPNKTYDFFTKP